MAQEPEDENFEGGEGGEAEFEGGGGGGGKKKLLLFVVLPLVLVIGGGAAAYFTGMADPLIAMVTGKGADHAAEGAEGDHKPEAAAASAADQASASPESVAHFPLTDMTVNIGGTGRKRNVLKVRFVLELASEADFPKVELVLPRIEDSFITYLREVRSEDLDGTAGSYRLKEELLSRVNAAMRPTQVREVLIKEFIIQ